MARRGTQTLIHRGYLYAQGRVAQQGRAEGLPGVVIVTPSSEVRMLIAQAWRDGYMASRRDGKKKR